MTTGTRLTPLLLIVLSSCCSALDLQFDKILCDESLPAYALDGELTVTCDGNNRCSFGDTAIISGLLNYVDMESNGLVNATGYASADLKLMTLDYELFDDLPFNFCGEFIKQSNYNFNECPSDGKYRFEVPYTLPPNEDPTTSWFATGWKGTSFLKIYSSVDDFNQTLLAHCKLDFETFVTQSQESGWTTLPSAAQATLVLVGVVSFLLLTVCCLACRPTQKHVTDEVYEGEFKALEDDYNRARRKKESQKKNRDSKSIKSSKTKTSTTPLAGKLQAQADKDWLPPGAADWDSDASKRKEALLMNNMEEGS